MGAARDRSRVADSHADTGGLARYRYRGRRVAALAMAAAGDWYLDAPRYDGAGAGYHRDGSDIRSRSPSRAFDPRPRLARGASGGAAGAEPLVLRQRVTQHLLLKGHWLSDRASLLQRHAPSVDIPGRNWGGDAGSHRRDCMAEEGLQSSAPGGSIRRSDCVQRLGR